MMKKQKHYLPPFILPETGMAIRTFSDCINSRDHQFSKHPQDYTLFKIANFNDDNGHVDQEHQGDSIDYAIPVINGSSIATADAGTIYDYMGLPTTKPCLAEASALPVRMYNRVYNEWFRDQNLQDSVTPTRTQRIIHRRKPTCRSRNRCS